MSSWVCEDAEIWDHTRGRWDQLCSHYRALHTGSKEGLRRAGDRNVYVSCLFVCCSHPVQTSMRSPICSPCVRFVSRLQRIHMLGSPWVFPI